MSKISFNINNTMNQVNAAENLDVNAKKSIFAGNSPFGAKNNPLIEQKKQLAGKQAMKLITDAFARDQKFSDSVDEMRAKKLEIRDQYNDNNKQLKAMSEEKDALAKQYGVSPDSQEQKDLELLQKYQSAKNGAKYSGFSDEEKARLKELEGTTRTEYQARVLEINDSQDRLRKENNQLEGQMQSLTSSIADAKTDHLKSQDMLKADEAAEDIMDAASKEAIGILINDAKEAIEEKAEEAKEKGEKLAEEREEFEERIEESKERRKEEQEIIENSGKANIIKTDADVRTSDETQVAKAQQDIRKILKDNNLLDEDIKGLKINLGF